MWERISACLADGLLVQAKPQSFVGLLLEPTTDWVPFSHGV
jgi:hypothetical protein